MTRIFHYLCCFVASTCAFPSLARAESINIASFATVTSNPAASPESQSFATDGDPVKSLIFGTGTKGAGSLTLTFPAARSVDKVRVLQGHAVYFSTAYRILGDADGDGNFEITLAEKPEAKWGQWDELSFPSRIVKALRFESLAGESKGARAHPVINEIEVYGEATVDELARLIITNKRPMSVPKLKPLYLETRLVQDGKATCAILVPGGEAYRKLGAGLAAQIGKTFGAAPRVTSDFADVDPTREHVIALGQMNNNKLIERLYWNRYVYLDSLYPGKNGFVIQTVHNPYPWTSGHNVVVLGGSTLEGVTRAVQRFGEMKIPDSKVLASTLIVQLPPSGERESSHVIGSRNYTAVKLPERDLSAAQIKAMNEAAPTPSLLAFQESSQRYLLTGEIAYLQQAKRVLDVMATEYEKNPERDMTWPEETNSRFIFAAWDAVEEAPLFTDAERLRYSTTLLRFLHSLVKHTSDYGKLEKNDTIIWNHTTFPLLGLYFGGRYFHRYYHFQAMEPFLAKAAGAFGGQEKSWKPQEDADSYITLTMGHMIEYALAENDPDFFTNGNIRKYGDYLIGICDNRGWAAGFGDSGLFKNTAIPDAGLPYVFWWTKDPQYLGYLNAIHNGRWPNPFDQSIQPQPPLRHVGLHVFDLDKQVYDYTKTRSYYGEQSGPPNVPYEQSFDKIAFRENFDPLGQYFILDGYSRGKHLQYDGNALLKLTDKGYDWLIDADYLVRNTTDHNMVSVIRDGRSEKLIPEATALLNQVDLPAHAFTHTMVKNYNGADWHRFVFWQKGGAIVMLDRLIAQDAGNYKFDTIWKSLDLGVEELVAPNRYRIQRGGISRWGNIGVDKVTRAGVAGQVGVLGRADSQLQWSRNLKAGKYRVTVFAGADDTGSDSLWLSVDGESPVEVHLPIGTIGASSASFDKSQPSPVVEVGQGGSHVFTLTLRESSGVAVQRVVMENLSDAKDRFEFAAVNAPQPNRAASASLSSPRNFYIVNADGATQALARRIGTPGPVKYLQQRRVHSLQSGQGTAFANLLYLDDKGENKNFNLQVLSSTPDSAALLAQLPQPTLLGTGNYNSNGIAIDAAMFRVDADGASLVDAKRLAVGDFVISTQTPVSLELYWKENFAKVTAKQAGEIELFGVRVPLKAGMQTVLLKSDPQLSRIVAAAMGVLSASNKTTQPAAADATTARALGVLWRLDEANKEQPEVRDFTARDLDGDGQLELLICRGNELQCYSGEKLKWKFTSSRRIRAVTVADLQNNGSLQVLCGGEDETLHVLDANGKEIASHKMIERLIVGQGGTVLPYISNIAVGDLEGDGKNEIAVGMSNSQLSVFNAQLERLWNQGGIFHGSRELRIADINADGKKEVLAANHYGSISVFSFDGKLDTRSHSELGDVAMDFGDVNGDGKLEIANGSGTGAVTLSAYVDFGRPMKKLWDFNNAGYAARRVLLHDTTGDGKPEVLVASDTGYLYALDATGKVQWQQDLGSAVLAMAILKDPRGDKIVVGQRDGSVKLLNLQGETQAGASLPQPIKLLKTLLVIGDATPEIVAVDEVNNVVVLQSSISG